VSCGLCISHSSYQKSNSIGNIVVITPMNFREFASKLHFQYPKGSVVSDGYEVNCALFNNVRSSLYINHIIALLGLLCEARHCSVSDHSRFDPLISLALSSITNLVLLLGLPTQAIDFSNVRSLGVGLYAFYFLQNQCSMNSSIFSLMDGASARSNMALLTLANILLPAIVRCEINGQSEAIGVSNTSSIHCMEFYVSHLLDEYLIAVGLIHSPGSEGLGTLEGVPATPNSDHSGDVPAKVESANGTSTVNYESSGSLGSPEQPTKKVGKLGKVKTTTKQAARTFSTTSKVTNHNIKQKLVDIKSDQLITDLVRILNDLLKKRL
jgi:hypothetical protein